MKYLEETSTALYQIQFHASNPYTNQDLFVIYNRNYTGRGVVWEQVTHPKGGASLHEPTHDGQIAEADESVWTLHSLQTFDIEGPVKTFGSSILFTNVYISQPFLVLFLCT